MSIPDSSIDGDNLAVVLFVLCTDIDEPNNM